MQEADTSGAVPHGDPRNRDKEGVHPESQSPRTSPAAGGQMQAALGRVNGHSAVKVQPPARGTEGRKRRTPTPLALAARLAVLVASAQVGLATAQACAAGKHLAATGSTVCTDCGAGTFSAVVGATVASTCATCVAGKYAAASASTVCTDCEAGKYSSVVNKARGCGGGSSPVQLLRLQCGRHLQVLFKG